MSLFRRRRRTPEPRPEPWNLIAEAVAAFARAGVEVVPDGAGTLRASDGWVLGLHDLAAMLDRSPRELWPDIVDEHARSMAASRDDAPPTSLDQVRDILLPRLLDTRAGSGSLPSQAMNAARELAPGLHVLTALDRPRVVSTLTDLDALGGWDAVWPVAMANLRRLPLPRHRAVDTAGTPSARVHLFSTDDHFGATRVLDLDHVLASALRVERPTHGTLVALPNRHTLAVHLIESEAVIHAVHAMLAFAESRADGPGPLSPHLYYRSAAGHLERVSRREPDGTAQITATGGLGAAMSALGLLRDSDD